MRLTVSCAMLALISVATTAGAQLPPAPAVPVFASAPAGQAILRAGTPITLRLSEQLTTRNKKSRAGSRFQMEVAEPVTVNGQVVIPAGSFATGEITNAKNNGMWGKSGKLTARLLYVRVNDRQIRLSGAFDDKGKSGTAGVVAAAVFVPVAGFFVKGRSADIAAGTTVSGFVDEDVPLAFAAVGPAPLSVAAPVPAIAPTMAASTTVKAK